MLMPDRVRRGQVYYADLSPVVGSEQGGIRPVVVIQNDLGNQHSPTVIVAAITSRRGKHRLPTHVSIKMVGLGRNSIVLLEQIRTIDKSRLKQFAGILDKVELDKIDKGFQVSFGINS